MPKIILGVSSSSSIPLGPDVYKLNAHWSEEDDCCFQPVFCPDCADTKNGYSSAIGHKVVCVGQTKQIFNLGEVSFVKQK